MLDFWSLEMQCIINRNISWRIRRGWEQEINEDAQFTLFLVEQLKDSVNHISIIAFYCQQKSQAFYIVDLMISVVYIPNSGPMKINNCLQYTLNLLRTIKEMAMWTVSIFGFPNVSHSSFKVFRPLRLLQQYSLLHWNVLRIYWESAV